MGLNPVGLLELGGGAGGDSLLGGAGLRTVGELSSRGARGAGVTGNSKASGLGGPGGISKAPAGGGLGFAGALDEAVDASSLLKQFLPQISKWTKSLNLKELLPEEAMLLAMSIREIAEGLEKYGSLSELGWAEGQETASLDLGAADLEPGSSEVLQDWAVQISDALQDRQSLDGLVGDGLIQALAGMIGVVGQGTSGDSASSDFSAVLGGGLGPRISKGFEKIASLNGIQERIASLARSVDRFLKSVSDRQLSSAQALQGLAERLGAQPSIEDGGKGVLKLADRGLMAVSREPIALPPEALERLGALRSLRDSGDKGKTDSKQILPDLIYMGEAARSDFASPAGLSGNIRLVSSRGLADAGAVETLRTLAAGVRDFGAELESVNKRPLMDSSMEHFLVGRLGGSEALASRLDTGPLVTAQAAEAIAPNGSVMLGSVRQAQAVMADMVERLQGQVALDGKGLRAVIHLEPPALGRLHVRLELNEMNRVQAHVSAEQPATQDFLQQNQSDLRQGLADQGFDPDRIELLFDADDEGSFNNLLSKSAALV